MKFHVIQYWK